MKALITGASSGLGKDFAKILSEKYNYDIIAVARNEEKLSDLKSSLKTQCDIISMDLSNINNCVNLYEQLKDVDIDIVINNAGFGLFGKFDETSFDIENNMIDLNIKSVHILTKLFIKKMKKENKGLMMNVSSCSAFLPGGPLFSCYYASKAYVLSLTRAIGEELKRDKSNVHICALCPGPVNTEFNRRANVKFALKGLESYSVAQYAIKNMLKGRSLIIPGKLIKFLKLITKLVPDNIILHFCYKAQKRKS